MLQTVVRTTDPGVTIVSPDQATRAEIDALRVQRRALSTEVGQLASIRSNLRERMSTLPAGSARDRLQGRADEMTQRIDEVERMLANTNSRLEELGASTHEEVIVVPPSGSPVGRPASTQRDLWNGAVALAVLLPLSIAFAVRLVQRGKRPPAPPLPNDLAERLARIEQMVEASAIEVERIGEGQRYLTRVLAAGNREPASPPFA